MLPVGNWIFSLKPAPPPPPKKPFDQFWEALGKFVKAGFQYFTIFLLIVLGYLFCLWCNDLDVFGNIPIISRLISPGAPAPVTSVPGQKLYAVVVANVPTDLQARAVINQLRASNIVSSSFFANGSFVVYIGNLRTIAQAENALAKVRGKGFPRARIVP